MTGKIVELAAIITAAVEEEREACALAARGASDHADCDHAEGYIDGRLDAEAAIRSRSSKGEK